jgi:hypothetical protein
LAATSSTCRKCHAPLAPHPVDPVCGVEGALRVTFFQLPALMCANMHRQFALRGFPELALERIAAEGMAKLAAGERRGFLFRRYHCGACGARLGRDECGTGTFDFDVTLEGLAPFRVELELPVYRCGECGKEQIRSLREIRKLAPAALDSAFGAAGLRPE